MTPTVVAATPTMVSAPAPSPCHLQPRLRLRLRSTWATHAVSLVSLSTRERARAAASPLASQASLAYILPTSRATATPTYVSYVRRLLVDTDQHQFIGPILLQRQQCSHPPGLCQRVRLDHPCVRQEQGQRCPGWRRRNYHYHWQRWRRHDYDHDLWWLTAHWWRRLRLLLWCALISHLSIFSLIVPPPNSPLRTMWRSGILWPNMLLVWHMQVLQPVVLAVPVKCGTGCPPYLIKHCIAYPDVYHQCLLNPRAWS